MILDFTLGEKKSISYAKQRKGKKKKNVSACQQQERYYLAHANVALKKKKFWTGKLNFNIFQHPFSGSETTKRLKISRTINRVFCFSKTETEGFYKIIQIFISSRVYYKFDRDPNRKREGMGKSLLFFKKNFLF